MARKIKASDLQAAVSQILKDFADDVTRITKKDVDEVTTAALKEVKSHAPVKTGKYKRSLKTKTAYESTTEKRNVIYSNGQSGLTHLLENGHAKQNGGRTRAFPHFKYGQDLIDEQLLKKIKDDIQGG